LVLPNADVVENDSQLAENLARRLTPSMSVRHTPKVAPPLPARSSTPTTVAVDAPSNTVANATTSASTAAPASPVVGSPATAQRPLPLVPNKSTVEARVNSCLSKLSTDQMARFVLAVQRLQRAIRATRARLAEQKAARAQQFRDRVADEILKSEREYVASLLRCCDAYLKPYRSSKALTKEQVTEVFSGVFETIVLLSRTLLSDLETRMAKWSPDTLLGDIFIKIVDFMKVYVGYIENFDTSIRVRQELLKSKRYRALLEKCTSPERQDLASFLIMPVQRLPRYILLLRELYKHTPPTHPDEPLLAKAVEKVSAVAEFVNEKKRNAEQLMQLHALQQQLKPDKDRWSAFAVRGRGLTRLGVFDLLALGSAAPNVDIEPEQVALMLCDDIVMLVKSNLDQLQEVARSVDAVRFGRTKVTMASTLGLNTSLCVLQRETRTVDLRAAHFSEGSPQPRELDLMAVSGDVLATLRCAHVAERDAWIDVFKSTRRRLVEEAALIRSVLADKQHELDSQHKQNEGEPVAPLPITTASRSSAVKSAVRTSSHAKLPSSPAPAPTNAYITLSGADAKQLLNTLNRQKKANRGSADLSKLKAARANLDAATELMVSLRAQLETIEVQLLLDSQLAKNKRMKKTQRTNMERIAASMRSDLDVAIADVDVLSEHVAQLVQAVGSAASATSSTPASPASVLPSKAASTSTAVAPPSPSLPVPARAATEPPQSPQRAAAPAAVTSAKAPALTSSAPLHEERVKAGAVLEKRESLSRARSRRRSAELPRSAIPSTPQPPKGRLMRRQAEKQLRTTVQLPHGDHGGPAPAAVVVDSVSPTPPTSLKKSGGSKGAIKARAKPPVPLRPPPDRLSSSVSKDDAAIVAAAIDSANEAAAAAADASEVSSDFYESGEDDDDDDDDDNDDDNDDDSDAVESK
jgi:hypothetical protein